jgi:ABC-type sulfate transport system permease component
MLAPSSWQDWIVLVVIPVSGIVALIWLMPWAARHPFVTPPNVWAARARHPYAAFMNLTTVFAGVAVVAVCVMIWATWMSWRMSRPVVLQRPRDHR